MALCHKKESIQYGDMPQEGDIKYGTLSQEEENPFWYFVTRNVLFQKEMSIRFGTVSQEKSTHYGTESQ